MDEAKTLYDLKVGDEVMIMSRDGFGPVYRKTKVAKVTKTQIHTGKIPCRYSLIKWQRADGREVFTGDRHFRRRIEIITPEIHEAYRRAVYISEIEFLNSGELKEWSTERLTDVAMSVQAAKLECAELKRAKTED